LNADQLISLTQTTKGFTKLITLLITMGTGYWVPGFGLSLRRFGWALPHSWALKPKGRSVEPCGEGKAKRL